MYNLSLFPEYLKKSLAVFLQSDFKTPVIACSKDQINHNLRYFLQTFDLAPEQIYFPVKVNHDKAILTFLKDQNIGFEIASLGELNLLKTIKVAPEKIIFSNPVKLPEHIQKAYDYGVRTFAFDSEDELKRISEFAPKSKVYLRIAISNHGAEWKLDIKFGAEKREVVHLMKSALNHGLKPCGIAFHFGWNNRNADTFSSALSLSEEIIQLLKSENIEIDFLNIGGGFPAHCCDQYALLDMIAKKIKPQLSDVRNKSKIKIVAEPGSFINANAAVTICSVVDVIKRGNKHWIFLDSGIFQGFQWIMGGLKYQIIYPYKTGKDTAYTKYTITGPTCDSHDVFSKNIMLPKGIKSGDLLMIYPSGAYISSAKEYNGFGYSETQLF